MTSAIRLFVAATILLSNITMAQSNSTFHITTPSSCVTFVPPAQRIECQNTVATGGTYTYNPSDTNNASSNILGGSILLVVFIVLGGAMYFTPSIVGTYRGHKSIAGIVILNLFLGWTLIGWVAALIWSATGEIQTNPDSDLPHTQPVSIAISEIEQLSVLHKSGHISDDEFVAAKKKLLGL